MSCFSPLEKLSPPSLTGFARSRNTFLFRLSPSSSISASSSFRRCTRRRAAYISATSYSSNTSRLDRSVPDKIVGSWGMIVTLVRRSVRPIFAMSASRTLAQVASSSFRYKPIPSITIRPCVASTKRKKLNARVDLPQPVEPTMPIFCRGATLKEIPCRTFGKSGYEALVRDVGEANRQLQHNE